MNLESPQTTPGPELPPPSPPQPPAPPRGPREEPRSRGVERLLAAVRARQRRLLWLQGVLLGTAALLVLWVAGGFLALAAPGLGRWVMFLSPVVGALVACAFGVGLALRTVGDDVRTARLIGEHRPELSLDVLAAVELSRTRGGPEAPHSADLADAFLRQMDLRAGQVDAGTVVDGTRLKHAGLVLGGVVLVLAVVLGLAGAQWRAGLTKALESASRIGQPEQREPITGDIELTYRYPAYTGLAPRTVPGTNGEVSAPAGTEVQLKTRSDREVERAELRRQWRDAPPHRHRQARADGHLRGEEDGQLPLRLLRHGPRGHRHRAGHPAQRGGGRPSPGEPAHPRGGAGDRPGPEGDAQVRGHRRLRPRRASRSSSARPARRRRRASPCLARTAGAAAAPMTGTWAP